MKLVNFIAMVALSGSLVSAQDNDGKSRTLDDMKAIPFRLTARVIDEDGKPIPGADVKIELFNLRETKERKLFEGLSDQHGLYSAESPCHSSDTPIEVTKDGYYMSRTHYHGPAYDYRDALKSGRFEPWDPTVDVVLKKIGKPIPMAVRSGEDADISIPLFGKELPFDVLAWDWLPPHGGGKVADWIIQVDPEQPKADHLEFTARITFRNPLDGVIAVDEFKGPESQLLFPRTAPQGGYDAGPICVGWLGVKKIGLADVPKQPAGFFIRLRTEVDQNGKVVSCHYGKMLKRTNNQSASVMNVYGSMERGMPNQYSGELSVHSIYINMNDNDPNLEFDGRSNLAPGLEGVADYP